MPPTAESDAPRPPPRKYGPRTCRICLEQVEPKFPDNSVLGSFGAFAFSERPTYVSDDAELGRLLSPCKCKGSLRYVHEGCLEAWRKASRDASNYWQCSVCGFKYQMARISWAAYLRSTLVQLVLTLTVFLFLIFTLGFFADPILNMWVDPVGTVAETVTGLVQDVEALKTPLPREQTGWVDHWLKGFFSFGIIGFLKVILTLSPFHWWNLRVGGSFGSGRRPATGGRARIENVNILLVLVGAITFLVAIWKGIRKVSEKMMDRIADSVLDVGVDEPDEEDESAEDKKTL
jgi:hypothetical protein